MQLRTFASIARYAVVVGLLTCLTHEAWAYPVAFTYQGKLSDAGVPATGVYDMQFQLFDSPTIGMGASYGTVEQPGVVVTAGVFTVTLNFGNPFFLDLYMAIGVKPAGSGGAYTQLAPRQPFTSTPYSLQTLIAQSAVNLNGLPASRYLSSASNGNYGIGVASPVNGKLEIDGGSGAAVFGTTTTWQAVRGKATAGVGVFGTSDSGNGVVGQSTIGTGVYATGGGPADAMAAYNNSTGRGIYGYSATTFGVVGETASGNSEKAGVFGIGSIIAPGVRGKGNNIGVFGESPTGIGIWGEAGGNSEAVYGYNNGTGPGMTGDSVARDGVKGLSGGSSTYSGVRGDSTNGAGVRGTSGNYIGVLGSSTGSIGVYGGSTSSHGVYGLSTSGTGVYGDSANAGGIGVYARNSAGGKALHVEGTSQFNGAMSKPGGSFKIDHPLDPENKYLSHSFVESPDMMNIYNGNVTTDGNGRAVVELPEWLEALNRDFRYQLTVIGTFAQAIVDEEVHDNRFAIATSVPRVKVSWQVTGIRRDAYAEKNRIRVEEAKPAELMGTYLQPAAFGRAEEFGESYRVRSQANALK